jgi:hypothetical protein
MFVWTAIACAPLLVAGVWPTIGNAADDTGVYLDESELRLPLDTNQAARSAIGDIDSDGDLDVAVPGGVYGGYLPSPPNAAFMLLVNDGDGNFTNEAADRLPSTAFSYPAGKAAVFGDVDGDGDLDVFVANYTGTGEPDPLDAWQNRLWINDGSGNFTDETLFRLPEFSDASLDADFGDIDSDGDLDIVVGNAGPSRELNRILVNNGAGYFQDDTLERYPIGDNSHTDTYTILLADVDGDHDLDLIEVNRDSLSNIRRNNGTGVFSSTGALFSPQPPQATDVRAVDLNGDGFNDLVFHSDASYLVVIPDPGGGWYTIPGGPLIFIYHRNESVEWFALESIERSDSFVRGYGLAMADVDRDGDHDMYLSGVDSDLLLINDGAGFFTDVSATHLPASSEHGAGYALYPACGDLDNDGDADLYLPDSYSDDRLYINMGSPAALIEDLIVRTSDLNLPQGAERALLSSLNKAFDKLTNERLNDDDVALKLLSKYITMVNAKAGKQVEEADAEVLAESAETIIDRLSFPAECL